VEAISWIDQWPKWPGPVLVVSGPQKCGKTHLGSVFCSKSHSQILTVESIKKAAFDAIEGRTSFVLDDAENILGSHGEEDLFHLINVLTESRGHLLIISERPPGYWDFNLPDLRSRLRSAQVVKIGLPDDNLVAALLFKLFADRQVRIEADVIDYMLPRIERSFESVQRQVDLLDSYSLAKKRKITIPLVREALENF